MYDALLFDLEAFQDLMYYINAVKTEIFGIGRIQRDQFDIAHVTEIRILPQEVSGADANASAADMEAFFESIPDEERPEWCFNWHSHVEMGVTPSGADKTNYKNMSQIFEVFVPMILNKLGHYKGWVMHSHPVKHTMELDKIWIYEWKKHYQQLGDTFDTENQIAFIESVMEMMGVEMDENRIDMLDALIKEMVTEKTYRYVGYQNQFNVAEKKTEQTTQAASQTGTSSSQATSMNSGVIQVYGEQTHGGRGIHPTYGNYNPYRRPSVPEVVKVIEDYSTIRSRIAESTVRTWGKRDGNAAMAAWDDDYLDKDLPPYSPEEEEIMEALEAKAIEEARAAGMTFPERASTIPPKRISERYAEFGAKQSPHNWSLAQITEAMEEMDFDFDEEKRRFMGVIEGKQVLWDLREAKQFLASMVFQENKK